MIARLQGSLVDRVGNHIVVDCGGVGYEVACSGYTLAELPAIGELVTLRVFTHAQENKIALFGFATLAERQLFDLLVTVKNVGPTTAMAILSAGAGPSELARLIAESSVVGLTRIKGIGKKTAELLVVELREKCEMLLLSWTASGELRPSAQTPRVARPRLVDEVVAALVQMGWRSVEAEKAVGDLTCNEGVTLETLLRQALRAMPR